GFKFTSFLYTAWRHFWTMWTVLCFRVRRMAARDRYALFGVPRAAPDMPHLSCSVVPRPLTADAQAVGS
ncbi:hypothetical protein SCP_0600010, partial [Sparassis crispa]